MPGPAFAAYSLPLVRAAGTGLNFILCVRMRFTSALVQLPCPSRFPGVV